MGPAFAPRGALLACTVGPLCSRLAGELPPAMRPCGSLTPLQLDWRKDRRQPGARWADGTMTPESRIRCEAGLGKKAVGQRLRARVQKAC